MNRFFCIIGMLAVVGCSSLRAGQNYGARSAIDTEGRSLSDTTALGDIDMAETTVGDLKGVVAPNYSIVSNAAMDASRKIPEIEDVLYNNTIGYGEASNIIWQATIAATNGLATAADVAAKADKTDLEGFATIEDLLAFYYPDGNVTSMSQITTSGIEYAVGEDGGAYVASGSGLSGHVVLPWKVTIGGNEYKVTAVGSSAFSDNIFTGLTAPTTVKIIRNNAFENCSSLTSINLPSVTSTGSFAFSYCHSLASINLPSATSIGGNTFYGCDFIKSILLPSATTINSGAFDSCHSLESVSIPSTTSIGIYAFNGCGSLKTIDFGPSPKSAVPSLSSFAFEGVPTSCKFIIPIGMYDEWISADMWSNWYAQGYKFEGYASTAQLANKADRATTLAGYGVAEDATNVVMSVISAATNAMEAVGTDHQIVRGSFNHDENVWNLTVSYANSANEAGRAGSANYADRVPWIGIEDTPTSLSGYGITDAVPSLRTVNGKPLTSDITLSASDLGAATADGLVAATTNVVHGDYADADRAAFPNGLGLKAGDGTDKGYVGLRLRNPESHGLEVVGTRVTSTTAAPYTLFQLTDAGIGFPKAGLGDTVQSSDFTFLYWDAFSRANHVLDYMPSSGSANYGGYPISGKAFLEYFWGLGDLPAKAKASVTVHAASNLVGTTGAPMGVSDIIGSAVKESVLAVTSDVPVYAYSSAWTSDWPIDDSAQPSQPQWADGTWSVYLVEGGQTLPGAYSVAGPEDATTLTIDIAGFPTVFTRESTVSGYMNVHGLARLSDIAAHTNRTDNPHRVTAGQVGAYTKEETDGAIFAAQKYIYDNTTETLYRFSAENDFLMMKAVTNVPPTPAVIRALEEMR